MFPGGFKMHGNFEWGSKIAKLSGYRTQYRPCINLALYKLAYLAFKNHFQLLIYNHILKFNFKELNSSCFIQLSRCLQSVAERTQNTLSSDFQEKWRRANLPRTSDGNDVPIWPWINISIQCDEMSVYRLNWLGMGRILLIFSDFRRVFDGFLICQRLSRRLMKHVEHQRSFLMTRSCWSISGGCRKLSKRVQWVLKVWRGRWISDAEEKKDPKKLFESCRSVWKWALVLQERRACWAQVKQRRVRREDMINGRR